MKNLFVLMISLSAFGVSSQPAVSKAMDTLTRQFLNVLGPQMTPETDINKIKSQLVARFPDEKEKIEKYLDPKSTPSVAFKVRFENRKWIYSVEGKDLITLELKNLWTSQYALNGYDLQLEKYLTFEQRIQYLERVLISQDKKTASASPWILELLGAPKAQAKGWVCALVNFFGIGGWFKSACAKGMFTSVMNTISRDLGSFLISVCQNQALKEIRYLCHNDIYEVAKAALERNDSLAKLPKGTSLEPTGFECDENGGLKEFSINNANQVIFKGHSNPIVNKKYLHDFNLARACCRLNGKKDIKGRAGEDFNFQDVVSICKDILRSPAGTVTAPSHQPSEQRNGSS